MKIGEKLKRRLSIYDIEKEFKIPHYRAKEIHELSGGNFPDALEVLIRYEEKRPPYRF